MYVDDFIDTTRKAYPMKEIIDKLDFIKIKNFCSMKEEGNGNPLQYSYLENSMDGKGW